MRIINYWEMRRRLFGDRACLPLAKSMAAEEIMILQQGFVQGLPHDYRNRKVL